MAQAMAIRAFADRDRGTHAIGFLIDSFARNANLISRQDVIDHLGSLSPVELQNDFEPAVKFQEGTDRIDPEPINSDKEELESKVKLVKTFADKWIAHLDKDRQDYPPPDIFEFDGLIDYLDKLYCKYLRWLTASDMESAEPKIFLPWAAAYSVPWIPPNEWPVEVLSKFE
jgi:hypothetical protein